MIHPAPSPRPGAELRRAALEAHRAAEPQRWRSILSLLALALGALCGCAPSPPPNVLLILVDALRADHLGCYGYPTADTPELDRLAARSLLFDNAYSNATFTFPSTASLFTATLPPVHRITHDPKRQELIRRLSDGYLLLPEVFRQAGYATALITFPGWVSPSANYLQGVDEHREGSRDDGELVELAIRYLDEPRSQPFFLYLHLVELHDYFHPAHLFSGIETADPGLSPAFVALAQKSSFEVYVELARELNQPGRLSQRDLAVLVAAYDRRLAATDRQIGRLLAHLGQLGLADNTLVAFTADHGEQFLEHHRLVHGGDAFYNEVLRVPLLVSQGSRFVPGVRATVPVSSIDLGPTLLELVGIPIPQPFQGESVVGRLDDDRTVYATDGRTWKAITRGWSYLFSSAKDRMELYDLAADPGETVDLAATAVATRALLHHRLQQRMLASQRHPYLALAVDEVTMPEQQQEALRALGYLD